MNNDKIKTVLRMEMLIALGSICGVMLIFAYFTLATSIGKNELRQIHSVFNCFAIGYLTYCIVLLGCAGVAGAVLRNNTVMLQCILLAIINAITSQFFYALAFVPPVK